MALSAPYRFVPLSRLILLPDWAKQVSHDTPFADGLCGELVLHLTAETRLCVGGRQDKATSESPGRVHFHRTPDGQPAIPGSGIKGMLRNVVEIASYGRFRQVEDQRLGVRDLSESSNFYCKAIVRTPVGAGWLNFEGGKWQITPCEFSRVHQADLIASFKVPEDKWIELKTAADRYRKIGLCPELDFDRSGPMPHNPAQWLASPKAGGKLHGRVVVTGQPGKSFTEAKAKKYEFIFHDSTATALPVSAEVMSGFRQIHEDSQEWAFWLEKQRRGVIGHGIPVFFHAQHGCVRSLGLAMMYKLPYTHSVHDAIRHTATAHLDSSSPDLAELIFGHLEDGDRATGLRGRVGVGLAVALPREDGQPHSPSLSKPCILNGPKPTFYPAYMRQDSKAFRTLMDKEGELAGWKRYPVKHEALPQLAGDAANNKKVQVTLETLPRGTRFEARLRFHNLRRVEFGALLWALDFGERSALRHAIGMGKPFGFGQISITIKDCKLRSNRPDERAERATANYLQACRQEFIDLMNQTMEAAGANTPNPWAGSAPIRALLDFAKPAARDDRSLDYLPAPKEFVAFRKQDHLDEVKRTFHDFSGVTPPAGHDKTELRGYESRFDTNLEQAAAAIEAHQREQEAAARRKNATQEEGLVIDIQQLSNAYLAGTANNTQKDKLRKHFLEADRIWCDLEPAQQEAVRQQARALAGTSDKALMKAAKKVLGDNAP